MTTRPTDIALAWLAAVNAGDTETVLQHTSPDVVIIGPRGSAHGHDVLRAWLGHARATFTSRAVYASENTVVVDQHGVWCDVSTGNKLGESDVATRFRIEGQKVAELQRYDDLAIALSDAAISPAAPEAV
jgi:ketosteroid isomerase-like protein